MAPFSSFSPSSMPPEMIEGTFVERESLATRLVDIFEESATTASKHNVLLVGPRGIGKSHLVSLVYHRLKSKSSLAQKLCIAYLREDEWGINSFLDLLLRVHGAVIDDVGVRDPGATGDGNETVRRTAEHREWSALRATLGSKTLLLIIENLDSIFERIGDEGQRQWRALMQTFPQWTILATTPALFSGVSRQVSPFYGFFEVIHLQPLTTNGALALLQRLATLNGDERTLDFLKTAAGRARVRAVQHIAGGNHRIFVLFYDFLRQSDSDHFMIPLLKTVDALTPYYQSQMGMLSRQQQKIINFLCEHRMPASVSVIAKNCLATHQTVASQLRQLLARRYVRVDRLGRESFYELTEPLLRICIEIKTHTGGPLHLLVDFVRYWFSREELETRLAGLSETDIEVGYLSAALKEYDAHDGHRHLTPEIAALCIALNGQQESPADLAEKAEELAKLSSIAEDWGHYARAMAWLHREKEAIPKIEDAASGDPDNVNLLRWLAILHLEAGSATRADELLDKAIALEPRRAHLYVDKGRFFARRERLEEAIELYQKAAELDPEMASEVAMAKARALLGADKHLDARQVLAPFLEKEVCEIFNLYGLTFLRQDEPQIALEYFSKATSASRNDPYSWGNLGIALCVLGRYSEAIEPLNRSLGLKPDLDTMKYWRCRALVETGQYDKAVESANPDDLSHSLCHVIFDLLEAHGPDEQSRLAILGNAIDSTGWREAVSGGLAQIARTASAFETAEDLGRLKAWNAVIQSVLPSCEGLSASAKFFDVLTRVKVFGETKAMLELPREHRLLIEKQQE